LKKQIGILVFIITVLTTIGVASATAQEIEADLNNIVLSGTVPSGYVGNGIVTVLIKNGDKITYVNEAKIVNGKYFEKFKYTGGEISNCTVSVKAGSKDITSELLQAEYHLNAISCDFEIIGGGANRFFRDNDNIKLRANIKNVWADSKSYSLIIASYDESGKLMSISKNERKFEYGENGENQVFDSEEYTIPSGTAIVKGFVWRENCVPLSKNSVQSVGEKMHQTGDRVAFIGDSITHIGIYPEFLEHYYMTKNPENDYYFFNKGISGQEAASIIRRRKSSCRR